jgi:uronate dehydrogenase
MTTTSSGKPFKRLLLTGAAGGLGRVLRDRIKPWADIVRLSDRGDLGPAREGEEIVVCDLADKAGVAALMDGVDAVLHFGGVSVEDHFDPILQANIVGAYNIYAGAHQHGVKRVIFASSNHAVGFYKTTDLVDADMPLRPDTLYGVSKCFGEALSRYYYDRMGIETVCVRIGSAFPEPANPRMMATYFSYDDLVEFLRCALFAQRVGHTIAFGVSDNPRKWWDDRLASHLGFQAKDSSTQFAAKFPDVADYQPAGDIATTYQGGAFILTGPK